MLTIVQARSALLRAIVSVSMLLGTIDFESRLAAII